ncbi:PAQR family membrane homeostasis protein TrhA [Streptomyces europaeiscabiei]|uniref:Hemolysin III family protein n=1 Tax=Streptomyces europaeiscabiei TaxID=146819 RepID=A0ABU4NWG6_9ACTN|nr:hemolysin III family protein [Streptomyces europaeiscabiei]MDX2531312.1 hemolysin III family protein [Streptomyces europaeiscabiei]MDX2769690.1 hemolysin III family protein [Streptomyces europaeiscabiei]MDX3549245.1 hemolysin III family protein [Streptomyces europaeiscabiei]MDX3558379.1 hemolysin III family protein [Streptomyces europaeiscabiei]MDX3666198.1 hemolysin III family protein [Streptomyces europaeiscabiei]
MIAEDTEPPSHGQEPQPGPGNPPDTLRIPAMDASPVATGRLTAATGLEGGVERAAAALKPRLRGWLHAGVFPLALVGGIVLIAVSRTGAAAAACSVYAVSACLLFGTSGVYHRGTWGPRGEAVLRRLDHANIFLIIAGTYTPLAVLLLPEGRQWVLLMVVWAGALVGIAFRVLWIGAPRWLYTPCYIALGWVAVFNLPDFARTGGTAVVVLVIAGGLLYTLGAVVYGLKRPNPAPAWFGFHEVFHALTIAAFTAHYTAILLAARY